MRLLLAGLLAASAAATSTPAPKPKFTTGLVFADSAAYQSIPLALAPLMGTLPASADLSSSFPPVGYQGQQASCVGWSVAYAVKSYQEQQERHWGYESKQHLFSPAWIYNQIKQPGNCLGGSQFLDALNLVTREG